MQPFFRDDILNPRECPGYFFRRLSRLGSARVERAFDGSDVTFTQWVALAVLSHGLADTSTALARDMGHDTGAMTRMVDQLEERGFVLRNRDASDRRVIKLKVSDKGEAILRSLVGKVTDVWNEILEGFDHDEVIRLMATLARMLTRLEELENEPGAVV
jgi:DNA-binding MarR family transcriptional regulator